MNVRQAQSRVPNYRTFIDWEIPKISGQDLITVHVYAPPLGVLKTYKVGSSQVDLYTPNDFPT